MAEKKVSGVMEEVKNGEFKRSATTFRNWIKADGSTQFQPESNRYHLYVSLACPWAHRTLILRNLKGLQDVIGVSVVDYYMGEYGWRFKSPEEVPGCIPDPYGHKYLRQLYEKVDPNYSGRVTVPVLWDKKTETIVNNESSEIIRMLNSEFNQFAKNPSLDLYPEALRQKIDEVNDWVYPNINNGVYRCGFATTQQAYERAFDELFAALDKLEDILSKNHYVTGDTFTEADVRLFTTLVRFDSVYVGHFKCNLKRIVDYPNIWEYTKELYQMPGITETVNMEHIKKHYYMSHASINPTGIVPKGPQINFMAPYKKRPCCCNSVNMNTN